MNIKKIDKNIIFLLGIFSVLFFNLVLFFYSKNGFLPIKYEIDTYIFSKISISLSEFSGNIKETIGMSPIYSFFLLPGTFFLKPHINLFIFNYLCTLIFLFFSYKVLIRYVSNLKALITSFLIVFNPFFIETILGVHSELLCYTLLISAFFFLKTHTRSSVFLFALAGSIRPEFIPAIPFLFIHQKIDLKKSIIFFIISITFISIFFSFFTVKNNIPFLNKAKLFSYVMEKYSNLKDSEKELFLNKIYFMTDDSYSPEKMNNTLITFKNELDLKKYILNYPLNYVKNLIRTLKIYSIHYNFLFILIIFSILKFKPEKSIIMFFFIPFMIIAAVPIEIYELRYYAYTIFIISLCMIKTFKNRYLLAILIFISINLSFYYNYNLFSEFKNFINIKDFFIEKNIENTKVLSGNRWLSLFTENTTIAPPPYTEDIDNFIKYIRENKVNYIALDHEYLTLGNSFYNDEFKKRVLKMTNIFKKINNTPLILKVKE